MLTATRFATCALFLVAVATPWISAEQAASASALASGPAAFTTTPALPDVCGFIIRVDGTVETVWDSASPEAPGGRSIEVYPNWPVPVYGSNDRGGVYANLDADEELEIIYTTGARIDAWNIDGSPVPGWPQFTTGSANGAPAYGDVDGDDEGEIVVSTRIGTGGSGMLYVYEADGSIAAPFPISLNGGATKTPALGDVDGDGVLDIVVEERLYPTGYVTVYKGDGTVAPGWPQQLDYVPGSAAAVGDITGDGIPEVVGESYYSIYAWDHLGNLLPGFPFTPGSSRVFSYSSPVLADLDGDGMREILAGDHSTGGGSGGRVHVLRSDGTPLPGWPRDTSYWIYGPPAVGDIDGDGSPDVAVGDQVLSGSPVDRVYAWDAQGVALPGFPIGPIWAINTQILLADLDGDDQVELMFDDNTSLSRYMGYNHDGTPMDGWPLPVQGTTFFINPFAVDIDGDGELDLSGGGKEDDTTYYFLWDANVPLNPAKNYLTILQYGPHHDGVYRPEDPAAAPAPASTSGGPRLIAGPNPFSGRTVLRLAGAADATWSLDIYAIDGRLVRSWASDAGSSVSLVWDGRDREGRALPAGVYLCVGRAAGQRFEKGVVHLR